MKTKIFKILSAGAIVSTLALTSCEGNDNRRDSNSERTEGDLNDPTKNNTGSTTDGMNNQNGENQRATNQNQTDNSMNNPTNQGQNTEGTSGTTDQGVNKSGTVGSTGKKNTDMNNPNNGGTK